MTRRREEAISGGEAVGEDLMQDDALFGREELVGDFLGAWEAAVATAVFEIWCEEA